MPNNWKKMKTILGEKEKCQCLLTWSLIHQETLFLLKSSALNPNLKPILYFWEELELWLKARFHYSTDFAKQYVDDKDFRDY